MPQGCIQLVKRPAGFDPRMVFGHPGASKEPRFAIVAGLSVDFHGANGAPLQWAMFNSSSAKLKKERSGGKYVWLLVLLIGAISRLARAAVGSVEQRFLSRIQQVTSGFERAGEGYFAPDQTTIVYQAIRPEYPSLPDLHTATRGGRTGTGEPWPRSHDLQLLLPRRQPPDFGPARRTKDRSSQLFIADFRLPAEFSQP